MDTCDDTLLAAVGKMLGIVTARPKLKVAIVIKKIVFLDLVVSLEKR